MHGYQIRRTAQQEHTELWADVKPGSLYGALHRMAREGVVEEVRAEQVGGFPARTVYAITEAGRRELAEQRDAGLRWSGIRSDPMDLALVYAGRRGESGMSEQDLRAALVRRREAIAAELASFRDLQREADPYLYGVERMTFAHTVRRLETELGWHDDVIAALPELLAQHPESENTERGPS